MVAGSIGRPALIIPLITVYVSLLGLNAEIEPTTFLIKNESNVTLGCKFDQPTEECTWSGPNGITVNSLNDYYNSRLIIRRKKGDLHCNLTFSRFYVNEQGLWVCKNKNSWSAIPAAEWNVIYPAPPKPPVIKYTNNSIPENITVFHKGDIALSLKCVSSGAKPPQEAIYWLINGRRPSQAEYYISKSSSVPDQFHAETKTQVAITKQEGYGVYTKANVTCVVEHATGRRTVTKLFGIQGGERIHIVQQDIPGQPGAKKIQCLHSGYPPPYRYFITGPNQRYEGQEVVVNKPGQYQCSAAWRPAHEMTTNPIEVTIKGDNGVNRINGHSWMVVVLALVTTVLVSKHH